MWTSIITVLCEKIRLNGEWLTQMTMISCALMQPKQTLSYQTSSPVSSLKGQLDTCPMARHQPSKLSPIKLPCPSLHFPLCVGRDSFQISLLLEPWGSRERKAHTRALGPSHCHLIQSNGGSTPHPHLGQGQREHLWGQVANPWLPRERWT